MKIMNLALCRGGEAGGPYRTWKMMNLALSRRGEAGGPYRTWKMMNLALCRGGEAGGPYRTWHSVAEVIGGSPPTFLAGRLLRGRCRRSPPASPRPAQQNRTVQICVAPVTPKRTLVIRHPVEPWPHNEPVTLSRGQGGRPHSEPVTLSRGQGGRPHSEPVTLSRGQGGRPIANLARRVHYAKQEIEARRRVRQNDARQDD
jgi:hypothetical protein